jgi:hypothetical protein
MSGSRNTTETGRSGKILFSHTPYLTQLSAYAETFNLATGFLRRRPHKRINECGIPFSRIYRLIGVADHPGPSSPGNQSLRLRSGLRSSATNGQSRPP